MTNDNKIRCENCDAVMPPDEEAYALCRICEGKEAEKEKPTALAKVETKAEHSKRSPSALKNLETCPHYYQDPNKPLHPNTAAGLRVHLEVECYYDPQKQYNLEGDDIELYKQIQEDEIDRADLCIQYVRRKVGEIWGLDIDAELELPEEERSFQLFTEPRLFTHCEETFGRPDLVLIHKTNNQALLFDWKDGWGWQGEAKDNPQGQAYSLGLMLAYPELEVVHAHFYYSRREEDTTASFTTRINKPRIEARITRINEQCDRAEAGEQLHQRGPQCDFCDRQTSCPEWADTIPAVVSHSSIAASPHLPKSWDMEYLLEEPDELARAMHALDFLAKYLDKLKAEAKEQVEDGEIEIPGYNLIESNSGISCSDAAGAFAAAVSQAKLPLNDFLECVKTLTPGKLVKKLALHTHQKDGLSKAAAERQWREQLLEQGIISEGTPYSYLKKGK